MSDALLRRCGEAFYGERWQSPLARDLAVAIRMVQRWAAGSTPVPPGVWPELHRMMGAHAGEIAALRRRLADELGAGEQEPDAAA